MDTYAKIFAKKIRSIREDRRLTQAELAEQLECSQQTVNVWESGRHTPKITMLVKIADRFDVTVDSLLGRKETVKVITQVPISDRQIVSLYNMLNGKGKQDLISIAESLTYNPNLTEKEASA